MSKPPIELDGPYYSRRHRTKALTAWAAIVLFALLCVGHLADNESIVQRKNTCFYKKQVIRIVYETNGVKPCHCCNLM